MADVRTKSEGEEAPGPSAPPLKRSRDSSRYAGWEERPAVRASLAEVDSREKEKADVPYFASSHSRRPIPPWFPGDGLPAQYAMTRVKEYPLGDFNPLLNTASYVNVSFEPEEEEVAAVGLRVNIADQTIYAGSFRLHNDVLNMIADLVGQSAGVALPALASHAPAHGGTPCACRCPLPVEQWHCPRPPSFDKYGCFAGAGTVGSTEACLLAGLALKLRWRAWYGRTKGLGEAEVRAAYPNLVISTAFQACWEKFFRFFDVEPRFVQPSVCSFTLDPRAVAAACDERTIGVVAILGNHYAGQYEPVAQMGEALAELNKQRGWQVGIHVDAASGGFVAPFQPKCAPWDFRVSAVLSIAASGHKFGESACGTVRRAAASSNSLPSNSPSPPRFDSPARLPRCPACAAQGWVVWRDRADLSEYVAVDVAYLGGRAESYTLNFSRPASGLYVQLYKFLRLGRDGARACAAAWQCTAPCGRAHLRRPSRPLRPQATRGSPTTC